MRALLLAGTALIANSATAAPTIDPMFADHAVIQRDAPIRLRGTASPNEKMTVSFAGSVRDVRAGKQGQWTADFAAMPASGPFRLEVRSADGAVASADNLMIGDIWLCSGQSNMEWPVKKSLNGEDVAAGANDPQLRLMKVPQNRQLSVQASLAQSVKWAPAAPASATNFSAACYFMTRQLRDSHGVTIGAIDSTWGGTAIASWTDEESVRLHGGAQDIELLRAYRKDPEGTVRAFGGRWTQWWQDHSGDKPGSEPWKASDRLAWKPMPKIGLWEQWGDPFFADFNGSIWARIRFELTPEEAAQGATLELGAIDDFDRSFVNGEVVGTTFQFNSQRRYPVRRGVLRAGTNEIIVFVLDTGGGGGFWSPADQLRLTLSNGATKPLGQGWEYSVVPPQIGMPPLPPWDNSPGITTLYNGMIAPLGPVRLKGVAWYQGEADVGRAGYDQKLAAMMKSWRGQFSDLELPFLIVGLAGFGQPVAQPQASAWAALINDQRKATDADRRTALVSAIDIGERSDIHPPNKQEVGRRLALAAEAVAYGDAKGMVTPRLVSASREQGAIVVRFDKNLQSFGGPPLGFELCGPTQASCRYASARVNGSSVVIPDDGKSASHVRYAWADYPIVNLYGPERLPVPPFEVKISE
jgi:sialate O-acetylesterase